MCFILIKFLENKKSFNLENDLVEVVKTYNRSIHTVTKYTLIEIFFSTDKELYEKVYKNTLDYYIKSQKNSITYMPGENCFIINNICVSKKKLNSMYPIIEKNKVRKNKSFIKIIGEIIKNLGGGYYLIKILQNYDYYELKENEVYAVPFSFIRKCEYNLIKQIFAYNNSNKKTIIEEENNNDKISTDENQSDIENAENFDFDSENSEDDINMDKTLKRFNSF